MRSKSKAGLVASTLALVASTFVMMAPGVASAAGQAPLNLANEQGMNWPCSFNPFNPSDAAYSVGLTYETLDFVNALQNAKVTPWLASSYAWSNANKTLTFTIRSGVKWTDGQPLTAADVAYTFNLIKKYPALDLNAVWSVLSSVTQTGANQVVFNFKSCGGSVLLLRRRSDPDRAPAHLVQDQEPGRPTRSATRSARAATS